MTEARNPLRDWYKIRWRILERDNFTCQYCGQGAPDVRLEVDHRLAIADGGGNSDDNLVTSCWACNRGKIGLRQAIVLKALRRKVAIGQLPQRRHQVLALLHEQPGMTTEEIMEACHITRANTDMVLWRLKRKDNRITRTNGRWYLIEA